MRVRTIVTRVHEGRPAIVTACIERGCCLDDEATLASCRATGFPNATGV